MMDPKLSGLFLVCVQFNQFRTDFRPAEQDQHSQFYWVFEVLGGGVIFWNRESPGQFPCVNPVLFTHAVIAAVY